MNIIIVFIFFMGLMTLVPNSIYGFSESDYISNLVEYQELINQFQILLNDYQQLSYDYAQLQLEHQYILNHTANQIDHIIAISPKTTIQDTTISWLVYDSKGNSYTWSIPIIEYEDSIKESAIHSYRQLHDNPYYLDLNGQTYVLTNMDGFIKGEFQSLADKIYSNSYNNVDFVNEVWYIVSQLTVYDLDINQDSEGRYAIETLTRTGGDCEDLVILIADILISSKYTDNWTFNYIFMDIDNPLNPQHINHIVLYASDGQYGYLIEATADPSWNYYPNGVNGWYYPVV